MYWPWLILNYDYIVVERNYHNISTYFIKNNYMYLQNYIKMFIGDQRWVIYIIFVNLALPFKPKHKPYLVFSLLRELEKVYLNT